MSVLAGSLKKVFVGRTCFWSLCDPQIWCINLKNKNPGIYFYQIFRVSSYRVHFFYHQLLTTCEHISRWCLAVQKISYIPKFWKKVWFLQQKSLQAEWLVSSSIPRIPRRHLPYIKSTMETPKKCVKFI